MFTTGLNSVKDGGSGNGSSMLVPTRFVWPYGGRRVSLIGSFTRWTEHLQMTPVEGCPTVFQAICRLTPGLHQYKFVVDGEWRHDEHQPFVAGSYGIVNTVDLSRGAIPVSTMSNSEPSPSIGMNMEVDSENFQRVVSVSHDTLDAYVAASRRCVTEFLSNHTAYDLLPDSGKVIMLDVNLPVKQAFHILYEQGIPVAPLWDSQKGQFVGMLSALDFILILRELGSHGSTLTEEELETHTIYAWKEGKRLMNGPVDPQGRPYPSHLIHASPYDSLKEVALRILHNAVATVPIIHSFADDGSFPQLLHLASLSGILKCICRHFGHSSSSLPILHQPIAALPIGSWLNPHNDQSSKPLAMLKPNASLSTALSLLVQAGVSCLPIVDENNSLLDIYSRSDITALAKDRAYAQIRLDETSIHQALQLGHCDASPQFGFFNGQRCQMCLRTDPLLKVMERLSNPGVRRVIVIEAGSKRVEGIISLSDVFKFLIPF